MTEAQTSLLKRRKFSADQVELWFEIYQLLFPGERPPSHPYQGVRKSDAISDFCDFFKRQAPRALAEFDIFNDLQTVGAERHLLESIFTQSIVRLTDRMKQEYLQRETRHFVELD